jgi:hypothetical protein
MRRKTRAARAIRFVVIWALYGALVAVFLNYLNESGFWKMQPGRVNGRTIAGIQMGAKIKQEKRIPNLWERPTTVTFKITKDTKIEICNGGTRRFDQYGNLWHEEDPPLRASASSVELVPTAVIVVVIDGYIELNAKNIYIQRLVGFHEGEEPRPEYVLGGPGWANNITFSGWVVSSTSTEVIVRYP